MNITDEYRLSEYTDLGYLDDGRKIRLKRNRVDGRICIEKHMPSEEEKVYTYLKEHPGIYTPHIYECIRNGDDLTVIEEYVPGKTLDQLVKEGSVHEKEAVFIICSLCRALKPLHEARPAVICRDIKADNIVMDEAGRVCIVDFNIARTYQEGKNRDTVLLGTMEYAAPEQFGFGQTDARTDIYALGILLNYLLTGRFPSGRLVGKPYDQIVRMCMRIDPDQRYQSVDELFDALRALRPDVIDCGDQASGRVGWRSYMIPGFRSGSKRHMLMAAAGYLLLAAFCFSLKLTDNDIELSAPHLFFEQLMIMVSQLGVIFIIFDYRGCRKHLPMVRSGNLAVRLLGYVAAEIIFFLGACLICALVRLVIIKIILQPS